MPAQQRRMAAQTRASWTSSCVKVPLSSEAGITVKVYTTGYWVAMQSVAMAAPESNRTQRQVKANVAIQVENELSVQSWQGGRTPHATVLRYEVTVIGSAWLSERST